MLFSWRITEIVTRLRNLFCPLLDTFKYLLKICWNINVEEKRKNIFMNEEDEPFEHEKEFMLMAKRQAILKQCDVMVDGRYIDSQRDITLKWRGSSNQRVISVQKSLIQNKLVLYCD